MSTPNVSKIIQQQVNELIRLKDRVLPVKIGREVVDSTRQNFRKGGFYGASWKPTRRQTLAFDGVEGQYGPLLSRTNHLMSSNDYTPGVGRVRIYNAVPYAAIHNEGGQIPVTGQMKKFFWAKFYETGGKQSEEKSETSFWKRMALKPAGSQINIPKRQFIGPSPQVTAMVNSIINTELSKFANGKHFRENH